MCCYSTSKEINIRKHLYCKFLSIKVPDTGREEDVGGKGACQNAALLIRHHMWDVQHVSHKYNSWPLSMIEKNKQL